MAARSARAARVVEAAQPLRLEATHLAGRSCGSVVSKYDDHLPLYRQAEIFARDGVCLETSTLSGWVGATAAALQPLVDALAIDVLAGDTLHVDDTPVPVLAPGIFFGSHLSARVSDKVLRPVLATILVIVGVRMLRA